MARRLYENDAARSRAWRQRHPDGAKQASRRWRERNAKVMAFLNARNKLHRQLIFEWVREHLPAVFSRLKREAKQRMPVYDLKDDA